MKYNKMDISGAKNFVKHNWKEQGPSDNGERNILNRFARISKSFSAACLTLLRR